MLLSNRVPITFLSNICLSSIWFFVCRFWVIANLKSHQAAIFYPTSLGLNPYSGILCFFRRIFRGSAMPHGHIVPIAICHIALYGTVAIVAVAVGPGLF